MLKVIHVAWDDISNRKYLSLTFERSIIDSSACDIEKSVSLQREHMYVQIRLKTTQTEVCGAETHILF
jgi:hypothetical protein